MVVVVPCYRKSLEILDWYFLQAADSQNKEVEAVNV